MGSKPSSTTNTTSSYTPPPQVLANYQAVTQQAQGVAATPYSAFGGQLVAPVNDQQNTGIGAVNSASGVQNPYNAVAGGLAGASSASIDPTTVNAADISQYESPYQNDVINATEAEINNQNAQQAASLTGNNISSGAFGGDRAGVAQAALAGQQDIASNATLANLNNQNFSQALGEANTQQSVGLGAAQNTAARQLAASQQLGTLGNTAQSEALNEANAQTNAGTLEQTTQQAQDTAAYNQFLQQQAYPFQTTGWLANIVEGIGSQSGGTSTGSSTTSGPSGASSVAGGLLGLASFLKRGGRVPHRASGGGLYPTAVDPTNGQGLGGIGGGSYVPSVGGLMIGNTMPKSAPAASPQAQSPQQFGQNMSGVAKGVQGLGNAIVNSSIGDTIQDAIQDAGDDAPGGGLGAGDPMQLSGGDFRRGGLVPRRHYDDGGSLPLYDDIGYDGNATPIAPITNIPPDVHVPIADMDMPVAIPPAGLAPPAPIPDAAPSKPDQEYFLSPESLVHPDAMPQNPISGASPIVPGGLAPSPDISAMPAPSAPIAGLAPAPLPRPRVTSPAAPSPVSGVSGGVVAPSPPQSGLDAIQGLNGGARGMRNNNPGNLIDNSWTQGFPGYAGSDGRFAIFDSPQSGMAGLDRNLQSYGAKGVNTPLAIASKWAPSGDGANNPVAYAGVIAKHLGIGLNDPIDMSNPAARAQVGSAIALVENGPGKGGVGPSAPPMAYAPSGPSGGLQVAQNTTGTMNDAGPQTSAPQFPDNSQTPASGKTGLLGLNLSPETRQLMLSAGLGIMGGTSMNPWVNIGQGGLAGIAAVNKNRETAADVGLKGAQTGQIQTQTALKQQQLQLMMKALDNNSKIFKGTPPSVTTPTVTAPSATATAGSGASAGPAPAGGAGTPNVGAPTPAPQKQVAPQYDPVRLRAAAENMSFVNPAVAANYRDQAAQIESGKSMVQFSDGSWGTMPGYNEAAAATEAAKTVAKKGVESHYDLQEVQDTPGGPTRWVPKSQILGITQNNPNATPVGVGAGSPPGAGANALANANPAISKQPAFYAERQSQIAKNEDEMIQQMKARQLSKQRLQALQGIMQNFQPGAFAGEKANLVAGLRSAGIDVPDSATANPAAFQEFTKNATANVFNDVKAQGGHVLVSEIAGLTKANANPELQPAAAAAIIGQGLGVLNYEDQHTKDYFDWKHHNTNAYDTSTFEIPWMQSHPVGQFVSDATKGIAYKGQAIPSPQQRTVGQSYMTPKGPAVWRGTGWQLGTSP